ARGWSLPGPARGGVPGAGADPVDAGARTDVQRAPVGPAEAAVGHLLRHRDLAELLPARGEHLDAGEGGGPEVPVRVHAETVGQARTHLHQRPAVLGVPTLEDVVGVDRVPAGPGRVRAVTVGRG